MPGRATCGLSWRSSFTAGQRPATGVEIYGKVFDSIYDGTLYGHWEAIVTMQQFIVLANADGVVDMTPQAIAARTSIPFEIVAKGIKVLESPDPYTRTPGEDGRRIILIDSHRPWGWKLVNHWKYRALRDQAQKRAADRDRLEKKRKENKDVAIGRHRVADVAHAYADAEANTRTTTAAGAALDGFEILWKAYPKRAGNNPKRRAEKAYRARLLEKHAPAEMIEGVARYAKYARATGKEGSEYVLQAATFLGPDKPFLQAWAPPLEVAKPAATSSVRVCAYCPAPSVGSVNRYEHCRAHESLAMDNVSPKARAA